MNILKRNITFILSILFLISSTNSLKSQWFPKWVEINYPAGYEPYTPGNAYLDVWHLKSNSNFVWLCGFHSKILRSTDGGLTWQGSRALGDNQLESITFLTDKIGFTSGSGNIYKSIDGGASWFDVTPPGASELWGNYFTDVNNGMTIGGGCGSVQQFYHTTNGGISWQLQVVQFQDSKMSDVLIYPSALGDAIAVGSGWLWASQNGLENWQPVAHTQSIGSDWQEEISVSGNTILLPYASGCTGTTDNSGGIRISTDFGKTWKDFFTGKAMFGAYLTSPTTGWCAGFDRSAYYTCDAGKSWRLINCGIENADLDDMSFPNDTTGIVVGTRVYRLTNAVANAKLTLDTIKFCKGDVVTLKPDSNQNRTKFSYCGFESEVKVSIGGTYYSYTIDPNNNCDISEVKKYILIENPKPTIDITALPAKSPCEGDTIQLTATTNSIRTKWNTGDSTNSILITKSGNYFAEVIDANGCTNSKSFTITFNPLPNPKIQFFGEVPCFHRDMTLSATQNYNNIEWFDSTGKSLGIGISKLISKDGKYYFKATNEFGCSKFSDTANIVFRLDSNVFQIRALNSKDNVLNFDTLYNYQNICKTFQLKNNSPKSVTIDNLYLSRNVAFTMPKSVFPLTLLSKDSIDVTVCFHPIKLGYDYDTLWLADNCETHNLNMKAYTLGAKTEGESRCQVPWSLEIISLGKTPIIRYSDVSPNPSKGQFSLNILTYSLLNKPKVSLYNSMGNKIADLDVVLSSTENVDELKTYFVEFYSENMNVDMYYLHISSDLENSCLPVLIVK